MYKIFMSILAVMVMISCQAKDESTKTETVEKPKTISNKSVEGSAVYFITPQDGDEIEGDVIVKFGLHGMGVAPAGTMKEKTGHHHILIDVDTMPDMTKPLPATDNIRHFGGGQTEASFSLTPGKHTLQLLLANYAHIPHDPPLLSKKITITVK